jgi:hypothetical protein
MAADRSRLAAALAYKQAEEERRRRMLESIPTPAGTTPAQPAPQTDFRTNLENLSIGVGEGLTNQLEGIKGMVTDPVGTAKGVYEAGKAVVRDPAIIASALRQMGQKAMSGPLGAGEVIGEMLGPRKTGPVMAELDVYHGTPHRFPGTEANPLGEFDASKIGTGEGAQAYGHGVYLAENPGVADMYRKTLTQTDDFVDGELLDSSIPKHLLARVLSDESGNVLAAKESLQNLARPGASKSVANSAKQALQLLESGQRPALQSVKPDGSLYKADLPDEMVDRMLDWDKPLSEQSDFVKKTLGVTEGYFAVPLSSGEKMYAHGKSMAGVDLINELTSLMGEGNKAAASEYLKSKGIPGIRYLDAGSRGQGGSGTRNFVVFPGEEKKVKILKRE